MRLYLILFLLTIFVGHYSTIYIVYHEIVETKNENYKYTSQYGKRDEIILKDMPNSITNENPTAGYYLNNTVKYAHFNQTLDFNTMATISNNNISPDNTTNNSTNSYSLAVKYFFSNMLVIYMVIYDIFLYPTYHLF